MLTGDYVLGNKIYRLTYDRELTRSLAEYVINVSLYLEYENNVFFPSLSIEGELITYNEDDFLSPKLYSLFIEIYKAANTASAMQYEIRENDNLFDIHLKNKNRGIIDNVYNSTHDSLTRFLSDNRKLYYNGTLE